MDREHGGFHGEIANDLTVTQKANKSLILNVRLLWTFARLYRQYGESKFLQLARRAYQYINDHFFDSDYGGVFWMVDWQGRPTDDKKKTYGQAFAIYALTEYFLASHDPHHLDQAENLFTLIEEHAFDKIHGGYFETGNRDWALAPDQRLSDVDMNEKKSMNTHLHVLEAYTSLLRVRDHPLLRSRLQELTDLFLNGIVDSRTHHFRLFFDETWKGKSDRISFGHDIEGSWLLCEAAEVLRIEPLMERVKECAVAMAEAVYREAVDDDGGIFYEADPSGITDSDKHWWPQAEAVVGFLNAYQLTKNEKYFQAATRTWNFIEQFIVDRTYGEWFWKVTREGIPSHDQFKLDAWKCPYHNTRCCLETMERTVRLVEAIKD